MSTLLKFCGLGQEGEVLNETSIHIVETFLRMHTQSLVKKVLVT